MEEKPKSVDDAGEKLPDSGSENWDMTPDTKEPDLEEPVEDIEAVEADSPAAKNVAEQIVERVMPDGTIFRGTVEEWKDEIDAWRDRAGVA